MSDNLLENILAAIGTACLVAAVYGLAGLYWALLLLGILVILVAYSLHTQANEAPTPDAIKAAVERALQQQAERHRIDLAAALSTQKAEMTQRREQAVELARRNSPPVSVSSP